MADGERGSASVANSRINKHGVAPGFMPLFQTLNSWEGDPHPRLLSGLGVALEMIQLLTFTLCPYFMYEQPIVRELVQAVWATAGPLWYKPFGPFSVSAQLIVVIIFCVITLVTATTFALLCAKVIESTNITISYGTRCTAEMLAGFLFIPVMHLFLAGMSCSNSVIINFPEETCGSTLHGVIIGVGVVGIVVLSAIGLVISTTLSDSNPQSTKIRSRSHNYVEAALVVAKVELLIFFHILVERDAIASYNIIAVVTFSALLALHCLVLPFYHHQMTSIRCATLAMAAFVGIVNCITAYCADWFHVFHVNSFVMIAFLPFAAHLGYLLSGIRRSPEFEERMTRLLNDATVPAHKARFPFTKGIMSNDSKMVPLRFRSLESDILSESASLMNHRSAGAGDEPSWEEIVVSCSETLVPFIDDVMLPTDAEVASRFVQAHSTITNLAPSPNILAFSTRTFLKNTLRYKRSGIARFHFANFLYVYVNRLNLALELLNEIDQQVQDEHDALVLYASFKVGVRVKELFGVRDNTHIHTFQRARQYHKEAMSGMCLFWGKLMESKGDIIGLALLTNQLTERRQNALDEYERALLNQKGDRLLLSAYASFLENVMCDELGAELYRQLADDVAEEKKNRIMRGSRAKSDVVSAKGPAAPQIDDDDDEEDEAGNSAGLLMMLVILLCVAIACSIGIFIITRLRTSLSNERLDAISSIGSVRGYAEETFLYTVLANAARNAAGCSNSTCTDSTFRTVLYNLSGAEVNMRSMHNLATYGDNHAPRTSSAMTYIAAMKMSLRRYIPSIFAGIFSGYGDASSPTFSSLRAEGMAASALSEPWMYIHFISTSVTDLVNLMYSGGDFRREFLQLTSNSISESLYVLGEFSTLHISDLHDLSRQLMTALIVIFAASAVILVMCFISFYSNLRGIAYIKASSLKLFTLIPYPTQEMLQQAVVSKMEQFEKMNAEDEKDVGGDREEDNLGEVPDVDPLSDELFEQEQASHRRESHRFGGAQHQAKDMKGMDDDVRRISRFFGGGSRSTSLGNNFVPSILKNPAKKGQVKKKKRVQFKIDGEIHPPGKKLREPKVKLKTKQTDIVKDLERSIKDIELQTQQENQREKMRKEQEADKMIYGGMRQQQVHVKHPSVEEQSNASAVGEVLLAPISAVALLAACVLIGIGINKVSVVEDSYTSLFATAGYTNDAKEDYERFQIASIFFANFGYSEHLVTLTDYAAVRRGFLTIKNNIAQGGVQLPSAMYSRIDDATSKLEYATYGVMNALSVAARALSGEGRLDLSTSTLLAAYQSEDETVDTEFLIKYPNVVLLPDEYDFAGTINTTQVPGLSADDALRIALRRLTSLKAIQDDQLAHSAIDALQTSLFAHYLDAANDATDQSNLVLIIASIAAAVGFVFAAAKFLAIVNSSDFFWNGGHKSPRVQAVASIVAMVMAIIVVALAASASTRTDRVRDDFATSQTAAAAVVAQRESIYYRQRFELQRYISTDSALTLFEFSRDHTATTVASSYNSMISAINAIGVSNGDALQTLITADLFFFNMQRVSMWLHKAYIQKNASETVDPPSPPFLATYDFTQEVGSASDAVLYTTDSTYQYSTPAVDRLRSAQELWFMSRFAATGRRAYARFLVVFNTLADNLFEDVITLSSSETTKNSKNLKQVAVAALACSAVASLVMFLITFAPALEHLIQNVFAVDKTTKSMMDTLFVTALRKCMVSLLILAGIFIAQFIIAIVVADLGKQAGNILLTARNREYLVVKSLTTAIKINASVATGAGYELGRQVAILSEITSSLSAARNKLYFAASATSSAFDVVSSLSSDQRAITFQGGTTSLDNQYLVWLSVLQSITSASHAITTAVNPNNTLANLYRYTPATQLTLATLANQLSSTYLPLITIVRQSNAQYDSDMSTIMNRSLIADVILFAAVIICVATQIYVVFIPVAEQLRNEEHGTRLMLNMIPQSVRDAVPKISMYLESGFLVEDSDERKLYGRCPKAAEFISMWGHESDRHVCFELLNESTVGQILIDARGIVIFANKHIPGLLGYDDLEGRNISVLVDEPLKSLHDGFLKRYVTSSNSRIIGSGRDVVGRCKNGEAVHLYLNLDEAVSSSGQQFFLGALERYSLEDVKNGKKRRMTAEFKPTETSARRRSREASVTESNHF
jgi:PAS domain S-box-containing protein